MRFMFSYKKMPVLLWFFRIVAAIRNRRNVNFVLYYHRKSKLPKACTFEIGAFCTASLAYCILVVVVGMILYSPYFS